MKNWDCLKLDTTTDQVFKNGIEIGRLWAEPMRHDPSRNVWIADLSSRPGQTVFSSDFAAMQWMNDDGKLPPHRYEKP